MLACMLGCGQVVPVDEGSGLDGGGDPSEGVRDDASLASLRMSMPAGLAPRFAPGVSKYTASVSLLVQEVTLTAMPASPQAALIVNGEAVQPGQPIPILLGLGTTNVDIRITAEDGRSRVYTVAIERAADIAEYAYGKASNPSDDDRFGVALALWGDTLVVGAPHEDNAARGIHGPGEGNQGDNSAEGSGAVYVFRRKDSSWVQEAYLKASNAEAGDSFGAAVALWGDVLAVAADQEDSNERGAHPGAGGNQGDNSAEGSGAVYVFRRTDGSWVQEAYLKASNGDPGDDFGEGLALWNDILAVGAPDESSGETGAHGPGEGNQDDDGALKSGAVYVFRHERGAWAQEAYIKASNPGASDNFGQELALWNDTLAVGAPDESSSETGAHGPGEGNQGDDSAPESGAVYVFRHTAGAWAQEAYLKADDTGAGDDFGKGLALWGDILAVSAPLEDSSDTGVHGAMDDRQRDDTAANSGAVYLFRRTAGAWAQEAYIKASNAEKGDHFGAAVALWRDLLVVGAEDEDSAAAGIHPGNDADAQDNDDAGGSGAVYLFRHERGAWAQEAYIKASNPEAKDDFGTALTLWGDALAVGAPREDSSATGVHNAFGDSGAAPPTGSPMDNSSSDSGAVYVFH